MGGQLAALSSFDLNKVAEVAFPSPKSYQVDLPDHVKRGVFDPRVWKVVAGFLGGDSARVAFAIMLPRSAVPVARREREQLSGDLAYLQGAIVRSCLEELKKKDSFITAVSQAVKEKDTKTLVMLFRLKTFLTSERKFDSKRSVAILKTLIKYGSFEDLSLVLRSNRLVKMDQASTKELLQFSIRNVQNNRLPDVDLQKFELLVGSRLLVCLDRYADGVFTLRNQCLKIRGICTPLVKRNVFGTELLMSSMMHLKETAFYRNVLCAVLQFGCIYDVYFNIVFGATYLSENTLTTTEAIEVLDAFEVARKRSSLQSTRSYLAKTMETLKKYKYFDALSKGVLKTYTVKFEAFPSTTTACLLQ